MMPGYYWDMPIWFVHGFKKLDVSDMLLILKHLSIP